MALLWTRLNNARGRAGQMLGQLLLGRCAEIAFERIYKSEMHSEEFELRDLREGHRYRLPAAQ
jgi:hypothetical protein